MPLPFILGGIALALAGTGIKKGFDAKEDFSRAERIGEKAKNKLNLAQKSLDDKREFINNKFKEFAIFKAEVFNNEIRFLVETARRCKDVNSSLKIKETSFSENELKAMEYDIEYAADILTASASSVTAGTLIGFGAYGAVGLLGTASTGTAIAGLSGAAATNATLAWLGGGSLAAGGFGMAGGMAVLSGIVAGPAIAVMGFMAASKAEEAVTDAKRYEAKVEKQIALIEEAKVILDKISGYIDELVEVINKLMARFRKNMIFDCKDDRFLTMLKIGKFLKDALEISVLDKDGDLNVNLNFKEEINKLEL